MGVTTASEDTSRVDKFTCIRMARRVRAREVRYEQGPALQLTMENGKCTFSQTPTNPKLETKSKHGYLFKTERNSNDN